MKYTYNKFIRFHVADLGEYMKQEVPATYKDIVDVSIEIDGETYSMTYEEFKSKIKSDTMPQEIVAAKNEVKYILDSIDKHEEETIYEAAELALKHLESFLTQQETK